MAVCRKCSPEGLAGAPGALGQPRENSAELSDPVCGGSALAPLWVLFQQIFPLPLPLPFFFHIPETGGFCGCPMSGALERPALNLPN